MSVDEERGRRLPEQEVLTTRGGPTLLWVTTCTKDRKPWLLTEAVFEVAARIIPLPVPLGAGLFLARLASDRRDIWSFARTRKDEGEPR